MNLEGSVIRNNVVVLFTIFFLFSILVCHFTHFCKTGEKKNIDTYKQTLSGIVASFFMTTIQGRADAIVYISNATNIPLKTIVHESDWIC